MQCGIVMYCTAVYHGSAPKPASLCIKSLTNLTNLIKMHYSTFKSFTFLKCSDILNNIDELKFAVRHGFIWLLTGNKDFQNQKL